MSQATDYSLANQPGSQFRTELNSILAAIQSLNAGAMAPSNPVAYMLWADTTTGYLKIRNGANDAWITGPQLSDMKAPDAAKLGGSLPAAYQLVADMVTTATANKGVLRDVNARIKAAAGSASDDVLTVGQYTAADVFAKVLTQDGPTSGLEAQKVGGLNVKVIDIGDWNMVSSAFRSVVHGIPDASKIRDINVIIRDDASSNNYNLLTGDYSSTVVAGSLRFQSSGTVITIQRVNGGFFDSTGFDSTSYNRGWITVFYVD